MLFSEIYSKYFNTVARIISEAIDGELTEKRIYELIFKHAFSESSMEIMPALKTGEWAILDKSLNTPIRNLPKRPLTILEKRWLKSLQNDPRVALFGIAFDGLEAVEPLFNTEDFVFFDRYLDADNFSDEVYIKHFRTIMLALKNKQQLKIRYTNRKGTQVQGHFTPYRLEYSAKDDKIRLEITGSRKTSYINLGRIIRCDLAKKLDPTTITAPKHSIASVHFTLTDRRNALSRVMLHFSDCQKQTVRIDENTYKVTLYYEELDETEILIRILSFGPVLKVTSPKSFVNLINERLSMQSSIRVKNQK